MIFLTNHLVHVIYKFKLIEWLFINLYFQPFEVDVFVCCLNKWCNIFAFNNMIIKCMAWVNFYMCELLWLLLNFMHFTWE
jgi:hypothetical protein